jgi:hypothetical protein
MHRITFLMLWGDEITRTDAWHGTLACPLNAPSHMPVRAQLVACLEAAHTSFSVPSLPPPLLLLLLLLLQYLVDKLSSVLDSRASSSPDVAAAGMVVNTMGYVDGLGYELLLHAIKSLKVHFVHKVVHLYICTAP